MKDVPNYQKKVTNFYVHVLLVKQFNRKVFTLNVFRFVLYAFFLSLINSFLLTQSKVRSMLLGSVLLNVRI